MGSQISNLFEACTGGSGNTSSSNNNKDDKPVPEKSEGSKQVPNPGPESETPDSSLTWVNKWNILTSYYLDDDGEIKTGDQIKKTAKEIDPVIYERLRKTSIMAPMKRNQDEDPKEKYWSFEEMVCHGEDLTGKLKAKTITLLLAMICQDNKYGAQEMKIDNKERANFYKILDATEISGSSEKTDPQDLFYRPDGKKYKITDDLHDLEKNGPRSLFSSDFKFHNDLEGNEQTTLIILKIIKN